jgi:site-specific DNA recombinase
MDPDLFKAFEKALIDEWNRLQGHASADQETRKAELDRIKAQCERLVNAIADGRAPASVTSKLHELEARQVTLEAELAKVSAPAPRLHPNLAEVYRSKVAELIEALNADDGEALREQVRALIERITLHPEGNSLRVEVRGELATILGLAGGGTAGNAEVRAEQIKMVAGRGFEPLTFRL